RPRHRRRAVPRLSAGAHGGQSEGPQLAVLRPPAFGDRLLLRGRVRRHESEGPAHAPVARLVARRRGEILRAGPHARSRPRPVALARRARACLRLRRRQAHGEGCRARAGRYRGAARRAFGRSGDRVRGGPEEAGPLPAGCLLSMRTLSPWKRTGSSLRSRRLSPPSKHSIVVVGKPGSRQGWRASPPSQQASARQNAPWLYNSASVRAAKPAYSMGRSASAVSQRFGTRPAKSGQFAEQSSFLSPPIALTERIISSGPEALIWSTDHVSDNKLAEDTSLLTRQLGGHRRGAVHRPRRRGHFPARSVVTCDVARPHRRRTAPFSPAPLRRTAARPRAALCHR